MIAGVRVSYDLDRVANGQIVIELFTFAELPGITLDLTVIWLLDDVFFPDSRLSLSDLTEPDDT